MPAAKTWKRPANELETYEEVWSENKRSKPHVSLPHGKPVQMCETEVRLRAKRPDGECHKSSCTDSAVDFRIKKDLSLVAKIPMWIRSGTTDENAVKECLKKNAYEIWHKGFRIEDAAVWLDIGAHIGSFTCWALAKGCKVIAFEPHPVNFQLLKANIQAQPATGAAVITYQAGIASVSHRRRLADRNGMMALNEHPKGRDTYRHTFLKDVLDQSLGGKKKGKHAYKAMDNPVKIYTLKEILQKHPEVEGVKIDIEGLEMEMLEEMSNWHNVRRLTVEWSHEHDCNAARFRGVMEQLGAHFSHVRANTQAGYDGEEIKISSCYGLFLFASKDPILDFQRYHPRAGRKQSTPKSRKDEACSSGSNKSAPVTSSDVARAAASMLWKKKRAKIARAAVRMLWKKKRAGSCP